METFIAIGLPHVFADDPQNACFLEKKKKNLGSYKIKS